MATNWIRLDSGQISFSREIAGEYVHILKSTNPINFSGKTKINCDFYSDQSKNVIIKTRIRYTMGDNVYKVTSVATDVPGKVTTTLNAPYSYNGTQLLSLDITTVYLGCAIYRIWLS